MTILRKVGEVFHNLIRWFDSFSAMLQRQFESFILCLSLRIVEVPATFCFIPVLVFSLALQTRFPFVIGTLISWGLFVSWANSNLGLTSGTVGILFEIQRGAWEVFRQITCFYHIIKRGRVDVKPWPSSIFFVEGAILFHLIKGLSFIGLIVIFGIGIRRGKIVKEHSSRALVALESFLRWDYFFLSSRYISGV